MSETPTMAQELDDNLQNTQQAIEHMQAWGLGSGVDGWHTQAEMQTERRVVFEQADFAMLNQVQTQSLSVTVHDRKKEGSAHVNRWEREAIRASADKAQSLAQYSIADANLVLAKPDQAPEVSQLACLWQPQLGEMSAEQMCRLVQKALNGPLADARVSVERLDLALCGSVHHFANSNGVVQKEKRLDLQWDIGGLAVDGDEVSGSDYLGGGSFSPLDVEQAFLRDMEYFASSVVQNLRPSKVKPYKGVIVLAPRAAAELLGGVVQYHIHGQQIMDKQSRWLDKLGQQVASEKLTLLDDPHHPELLESTGFDRDGLPTGRKLLIENGRLQRHVHSLYTARACKAKAEGMAGGPFALSMQAGDQGLAELVSSREQVLVVGQFSGNADPVRGDFSGVAKASRLYAHGKDQGAVGETMISGSLFCLLEQIVGVSRETERIWGSSVFPFVAVDGVTVS